MTMPLEGIRIMDFGQVGACPIVGMLMAEMGADVVKVEKIQGESMREGVPEGIPWSSTRFGKDEPMWMWFNRSKRGLCVDGRTEEGKKIINKLAERSDVVIHNFRPKGAAKLGLTYEELAAINPRIILMNLFAYGESGPMRNWAGGDAWIQGISGMVSLQSAYSTRPSIVGFGGADISGAWSGIAAVLLALLTRERTGIGQEVTTSLLSSSIFSQGIAFAEYLVADRLVTRETVGVGYFPYGAYQAKDGEIVTFYGVGESWAPFCKILGIEHLLENPRYATQEQREEHCWELFPILDEAFSQRTREEWQQEFRNAKLRADPALNFREMADHPQIIANEMIEEVDHPVWGRIKMPGIPIKLKETPGKVKWAPPLIGQHTEEVLRELGYSQEQVEQLFEAGVVRNPTRWVQKSSADDDLEA